MFLKGTLKALDIATTHKPNKHHLPYAGLPEITMLLGKCATIQSVSCCVTENM